MSRILVLIYIIFLSLFSKASFAQVPGEQAASMRGMNMTTFGRIIFDFRDLPKYDVKSTPGMMIITFDQSLKMQVDNIGLELPSFISGARMDPDRKVLRILTMQKLTFNTIDVGEDLYLDLLPEAWKGPPPGLPNEVIADLSRRARIAEAELRKVSTTSKVEVKVEAGATQTLSRLSFFAGGLLPNRITNSGKKIELIFEGPFKLDIGKLRSILPRGFESAGVAFGDNSITVILEVSEGLKIKTSVEDGAQLIDVAFKGLGENLEVPDLGMKTEYSSLEKNRSEPIETGTVIPTSTSPGVSEIVSDRSYGPPILDPATSIEVLDDDSIENVVTRALVRGADRGLIRLVFDPENGGWIDVQTPEPIPIAAFRRGDDFWIVFDSEAGVDVSALTSKAPSIFKSVESGRSDLAAFVRLKLLPASFPTIKSTPTGWSVSFSEPLVSFTKTVGTFVTQDDALRSQMVASVPRAGRVVRIDDPLVGDTLLVVPSADETVGVSEGKVFPELAILPSLQGVVFGPLVDDLQIKGSGEEITLTRVAGLNVSDERFGSISQAVASNVVVMQKTNWLADRSPDLRRDYQDLFYEMAMSPPEKRNAKRLALARILAANGLYSEADSAFGAAMMEDRKLAASAANILEGAVYKALAGRLPESLKALSRPELARNLESFLWRSFVAAEQGNWGESLQLYRNAGKVIETYPPELANRLRTSIGEAAIEQGELGLAGDLVGTDLSDDERDVSDLRAFLQARLDQSNGGVDFALREYDRLSTSPDRGVEARARLARVLYQIEKKKIEPERAVAELSSISLIWRGSDVEAKSLVPLVRMLLDKGEWREGLDAARRLNILYADKSGSRNVLNEVSARLSDIFEKRDNPALTDVAALSIFMDFKEFLPVGRKGDELIRKFSDRLVDLGLLSQAAEILRYQVEKRYEGLARTSTASRLAFIYLLDKKPLSALEVLSSTRFANMPDDLRRSRLMLEARARAEIGNTQLALELLEGETKEGVGLLRADIFWYAKSYLKASELYEASLEGAWAQQSPLSPEQSRVVLRAAIGYALSNDNLSIDRLKTRYSVKMARTDDAAPFRLLTLRTGTTPALASELAGTVTSGKYLDGFLSYYRDRYLGSQS